MRVNSQVDLLAVSKIIEVNYALIVYKSDPCMFHVLLSFDGSVNVKMLFLTYYFRAKASVENSDSVCVCSPLTKWIWS